MTVQIRKGDGKPVRVVANCIYCGKKKALNERSFCQECEEKLQKESYSSIRDEQKESLLE